MLPLTLLSGCGGGNGVYSFFTLFFLGSLRLARFLCRNLGRKRSQFCIRSSGSLDSSRLIIRVWWLQPWVVVMEGQNSSYKDAILWSCCVFTPYVVTAVKCCFIKDCTVQKSLISFFARKLGNKCSGKWRDLLKCANINGNQRNQRTFPTSQRLRGNSKALLLFCSQDDPTQFE